MCRKTSDKITFRTVKKNIKAVLCFRPSSWKNKPLCVGVSFHRQEEILQSEENHSYASALFIHTGMCPSVWAHVLALFALLWIRLLGTAVQRPGSVQCRAQTTCASLEKYIFMCNWTPVEAHCCEAWLLGPIGLCLMTANKSGDAVQRK